MVKLLYSATVPGTVGNNHVYVHLLCTMFILINIINILSFDCKV